MSMISHLLKTDIRRSRVLLSLWLLLVLMQCALMGSSARPDDLVLQGIYTSIAVMVPLFQIVLLVVIIPVVVQEEPLVGTTAFWFTRPIARATLLKGKALFAAMLIALPSLAEVAVLAVNGVTPHDLALAVPEITLGNLVTVVTIAGVAVFTASAGRYIVVGANLLVATVIASAVVTWLRLWLHPESMITAVQNLPLSKTRGLVENLWVVGAGGAVIAHQYLTRRTARSLIGAGVIIVVAIAILGFWPWNFFPAPVLPAVGAQLDAAAVKISLRQTTTGDRLSIRGGGDTQKDLQADLDVTGLPAGWTATLREATSHLDGSDGQPVPVQPRIPGPSLYQPDAAALENALGGISIVNGGYRPAVLAGLLSVKADTYRQYAGKPLKLTADLQFIASRYVVAAEMPLVRGARYDHGSEHVVITDVLQQGDGLEVLLRQSKVKLLFSRANGAGDNGTSFANFAAYDNNKPVYLLLNEARNQAVLTKRSGFQTYATGFSFFSVKAARLVQNPLRLEFGSDPLVMVPKLDADWLAGAKLVRLEPLPIGTFTKQLTVENFRLDGQNRSHTRQSPRPPADNSAALARITLPENPTKAQVRDYVDSILLNSQRQSRYGQNDSQVAMLVKIGRENLDVLLVAAEQAPLSMQFYIDTALIRLAGPEDKALVLPLLAEHQLLVELVTKYGWEADARDILLAELRNLRDERLSMPGGWIQAIAALKDPTTYPDLKAYLLRGPNRYGTFNAIRHLPGIDLTDTAVAAWQKAKTGQPREVLDASAMAADLGQVDALDALADIIRQNDSEFLVRSAVMLFRRYTSARGDTEALLAWYEANKGRLTFDSRRKKFLAAESAAEEGLKN